MSCSRYCCSIGTNIRRMLRSRWLPLFGMLLRNKGCRSGAGAKRTVSTSSVSGLTLMIVGTGLLPSATETKRGRRIVCGPVESQARSLEFPGDVDEQAPAQEVVLRGGDNRPDGRR